MSETSPPTPDTAEGPSAIELRHAPPFLFGILVQPFSAAVAFLSLAVPHWLEGEGMSLEKIALISGTAFMPHALKVFWAPLIDLGPRRKRWYFGASVAVAALLLAAVLLPDPIHHLGIFTVLLTGAQVAAATSSAALDALMAITTHPSKQGRAGGYYAAGNVGGTSLLGAFFIWLMSRTGPHVAGPVMAGLVLLTCVWALDLVEPRAEAALSKALAKITALVKDLLSTFKSREGITGLIICAAPVGCGALTNLWTGMTGAYHVSTRMVEITTVVVSATSALGSVVGGYVADRINRRLAYCISGGITGLAAFVWALCPLTPMSYAIGTAAYGFANGMAFAAFYGMVLEIVSHGAAVTTKYTAFVAISNLAISYATIFDGWSGTIPTFAHFGKAAPLVGDAVITFAGIFVVALMTLIARRFKTTAPAPVAS